MNIPSPETLFSDIHKRIPAPQRLAFVSTLVAGFCCHLFIFANSMYNNDDIRYLYVTFDKPELGRWLQTYFAGISSYYSLPVINGLLALLYAAVAAMLITAALEIKSKPNIILTGALLVTFPTMASLYSFMFAADPFILSCAFACASGYLATHPAKPGTESVTTATAASTVAANPTTNKRSLASTLYNRRIRLILSAVFLMLSVAIYQAYLPFALLIMLIYYIISLCAPDGPCSHDDRSLISLGVGYILVLICGMGAYYIGMQIMLRTKNIDLSSYQGIGQSSFPGPSQLISRMHTALGDFISFFHRDQILTINSWLFWGCVLTVCIIIISFAIMVAKSGIYRNPLRVILTLFAAACIPFAVNVIWLISDGVNYHILMRHAWCLLFIGALAMAEQAAPLLKPGTASLVRWSAFLACAIIAWNYALIDNIGYFNMNFRYEKTYALCLKIVDRMEQLPDYDRDNKIAFIGTYSKLYQMDSLDELLDPMAGMKGPHVFGGGSHAYLPFMQNCLGEDIRVVDRDEEEAIRQDPRFIDMPRFPNEGSIQVIDDVTVVKLND